MFAIFAAAQIGRPAIGRSTGRAYLQAYLAGMSDPTSATAVDDLADDLQIDCRIPPTMAEAVAEQADEAMREAVARTLASMAETGQEAPDEETLAAAQAKAREMLREAGGDGDDPAAGINDLRALTSSMGLPAARIAFRHMIKAAGVRGAVKHEALASIKAFSPITEVGSMKIDFFNRETGKPDVAWLLLDECRANHDLGAQLDKIKPHVAPEKWPEILKHCSTLIGIGRTVYAQLAKNNLALIRKINGLPASDPCTEYLAYKVDMASSTLYLGAAWPNRIGLFVHLDKDVPRGA
jgi:hypothetical protein